MSQKFEFDYDGQYYTLEFSRNIARQMETAGFIISEVDSKPLTRIPQLWQGAFMMHHKKESKDKVNEMFTHFTRKADLVAKLVEMYYESMTTLIEDTEEDDPKKIEW